jgi:nucleotidyltransferase/DNA polymerase involved in DNA repair
VIGVLLVPRFPVACELAERPELRGRPVAVARPDGSVWAVSAEAEALGVASGAPMRVAMTRCPALDVLEGRPAAYEDQAEAILTALEAAVPGVEPGRRDGDHAAFVELGGLRRLYGTGRRMAAALLDCAPAELGPRLGIAPSKFLALAAAHHAQPGGWHVVDTGAHDFLAHLPVSVLPVSDEMVRRLRLLGVDTLETLSAIPPAALAAQFGGEGALAARLVAGEDGEPVRPRVRGERVIERVVLETPLANREALLVVAEQALASALRQPLMRERATRQVRVRAAAEQGTYWERTLTFKEAQAEREGIWVVLRQALQEAQVPGPVSVLRLELVGLTSEVGKQLSLPVMRRRVRDHLEEAMRQLKARYGYCPVGRIVEVEPWSRVPERRLALIDFDP